MVIQSALPGSFEAPLSPCKCDFITLAENRKKCRRCEQGSRYHCEKVFPLMDGESNQGNARCSQLSSVCTLTSCSQLSSVSTMMENSVPTLMYQRRKSQTKSASEESQIGSEDPGNVALNMKLESDNDRIRIQNDLCCENDTYSSSKSNGELGSTALRTEVDETGECSSSSELVVQGSQDHLSERDKCISIIRNQWFAKGIWPFKVQSSDVPPDTTTNSSCFQTCKVCETQERLTQMLICDQCEEAFHKSCCNPRVRKIPVGEWFCYSCLKKKHKILNEMSTNKRRNNGSEVSTSEDAMLVEDLGPIASMLIGVGPYTPGVRIGQQFQADVPNWSCPCFEDVDAIEEPAEISPAECVCLQGQNRSKLPWISSIGNWVQCRQVIEGIGNDIDGTICGKWRRAPLFEVQTDDWECFRCVLWDPAHADCAVPQELGTEEILKQLKYIEMLRHRLIPKRRKLDQAKEAGPRENLEAVKKIQAS